MSAILRQNGKPVNDASDIMTLIFGKTEQSSKARRVTDIGICYGRTRFAHDILRQQTVPPPVLPSNIKKLAIGGSRPPKAFSMSCPKTPPTIAQTGLNSCLAPLDNDL